MNKQVERRKKLIQVFISDFLLRKGYPPTLREIGEEIGIDSTSHIDYYLKSLERDKKLVRTPNVARGIRLVEKEV